MLPVWSLLFGVAFGAVVGSFLNVLIYRLPRRLSIVYPPSHCPECKHPLGVVDLIPLLSFLLQRARCRYCRAPISWRYFLVEAWSSALWTFLWWVHLIQRFDPLGFIVYALACSLLIAIFFIDLHHYLIPDELNSALLLLGIGYALVAPGAQNGWDWSAWGVPSWQNALLGAELGAALFCFIALAGRLVFRKDAMGHGDIKLARALGALLMLPRALAAFGLAVALGAIIGAGWLLYQHRHAPAEGGSPTDGEAPPPEPLGALLFMCLFYLLWLDVWLLFLPSHQRERFYEALGRWLGMEAQEESQEEPAVPGMLPFGPFLVLGVITVVVFNSWVVAAVKGYLNWVSGGLS